MVVHFSPPGFFPRMPMTGGEPPRVWIRGGPIMWLAMSGAGWFGVGLVGVIIWVAIAFWPARVARRKGHSWLLFFIFSLFFFPGALITAYLVRDRRARSVGIAV